ncbi:hypothetical protein MBLNU230_g6014t1 [Neophaeotheca triangularis]
MRPAGEQNDPWNLGRPTPPTTLSVPPPGLTATDRATQPFPPFPTTQPQRWVDESTTRRAAGYRDMSHQSPWPASPMLGRYSPSSPMSQSPGMESTRSGYNNSWEQPPWPHLRRSSSDNARLSQYPGAYFPTVTTDTPSSASSYGKTHPQRRPSNRDEFDGPSQLLDKPSDSGYEPKEDDLPQLPVTLYAQEQDEILSEVNDRLSQSAYDFVAKYQFPIPLEPDKRPVRVPGDREWSEWVYLLKRLATKRRIPARVLYNGQIKQLITILENSLEMRHAAKHQSRPLKDDRNILQLVSSGLQVAKILKDPTAMRYLDRLYVQTERLVASRRLPAPTFTAGPAVSAP